ncbi:MAG: hypothetical protein ACREN6_13365 [Gemmatimonadaceae bacterium]
MHISTRLFGVVFACGLVGALAACNRYEYRKIECPPPAPSAQSTVAWHTTPAHRGELHVRVVTLEWKTFMGIPQGASARLGPDPLTRGLDPNAEITFSDVSAGTHALMVREIGYPAARGTIRMPPDSGVDALVTLAEYVVVLDGPCGLQARVRKPWWKP